MKVIEAMIASNPEAAEGVREKLGDAIAYAPDAYVALEDADALLICTEWNEFRRPDFTRMQEAMSHPLIIDGRNLYDPQQMASLGFRYESIGRPSVEPVAVTRPRIKEGA